MYADGKECVLTSKAQYCMGTVVGGPRFLLLDVPDMQICRAAHLYNVPNSCHPSLH